MGSGADTTWSERGQSGPIAFVLVFVLVVASTGVIVFFGATAIQNSQNQLGSNNAENALTQFDSQTSLVALGTSNVQEVSLSSGSANDYRVVESGHITVSANGSTIIDEELGAVVYESDSGGTVAYQGGGVWRTSENAGSVMVSPPEVHYREETLTLPLVTVDGEGALGDSALVSYNSSDQVYPTDSSSNPLQGGRTTVTVHSEYYRAWGTYFEERTDGGVSYDDANNNVTLTLITPIEQTTVTSSSASLAASGTFEVQGSAAVSCGTTLYSNSYNSSDTSDDYCTQESNGEDGNEGDIVYGADIDISSGSGSSNFFGDIVSGGTVSVSGSGCGGQPCVFGDINYTTDCTVSTGSGTCSDAIATGSGGTVNTVSGIETSPPINSIIDDKINATDAPDENDNDETLSGSNGSIQGNTFQYNGSQEVEISAGTYYVTEISPDADQTIYLNTTNGDVTLVVQENIDISRSGSNAGRIEVLREGGVANVYVGGTGGNTNHLHMDRNAVITNDGDDAPQFQLHGRSNFTAEIGSGQANQPAIFVGAIYAPPGDAGSGRVDIDGGEVFGGVITGTTTIDGGSIHYDEALGDTQIVSQGQTLPDIQYIHASVNRVNVTAT